MRTYQLKNPYFAHGWDDWELLRTNGDTFINTVDSIKYGLMAGRESPAGMPTVGNNYMLLARQAEISGAANDVNSIDVRTKTAYDLSEGDLVVVDAYFQFNNKDGVVPPAYPYGMQFRCSVDFPSTLNPLLQSSFAGETTYKQRLAWRSPSDQSVQIGVGITLIDVTSIVNTFYYNWVGIDNVRVFSAVDYYTVAEANNTDGVV